MSLNKFISVKAIFTAANLTSKAGYPIDYNSPKFNVSVNNICRWKKGCSRKVGAGRKISN